MDQKISDSKRMYLELFAFDQEYRIFPNEETYQKVFPDRKRPVSSNEMFEQFSILYDEDKTPYKDQIDNEGGCEYSYLSGLSSSSPTGSPILCYPMTGSGTTFDSEPLGGKAIILKLDGSASSYRIHKDGHVYVNGVELFKNLEGFETGALKLFHPRGE